MRYVILFFVLFTAFIFLFFSGKKIGMPVEVLWVTLAMAGVCLCLELDALGRWLL
jgi:hypothetical protein